MGTYAAYLEITSTLWFYTQNGFSKIPSRSKEKVYPRMTRIHMSKQRGQFLLNQTWREGDANMKRRVHTTVNLENLQTNFYVPVA